MWDRDNKITREKFDRNRKSTKFINLSSSKFCNAGGHLMMRSCLKDSIIESAPRFGKFIKKLEIYRQFPPRRVKKEKCLR